MMLPNLHRLAVAASVAFLLGGAARAAKPRHPREADRRRAGRTAPPASLQTARSNLPNFHNPA
jgi:hypothetical protein